MSKTLLTVLLIACSLTIGTAQEIDEKTIFDQNTPISIQGNKYYQNETRIASYNIKQIVKSNSEAFTFIKSAKRRKTWAQLCAGTGAFMIGGQLGRNLTNQRFLWSVAGAGAGLIVVSVPLFISSKNKTHDAVETFNSGLDKTSNIHEIKPELKLASTGNGLGLFYKF